MGDNVPEYVAGQRASRGRLAQRMTRTFVLAAGVLLLGMGLALTWVSYDAQLDQVRVRQQKTAREAALMTMAYLSRARETLTSYGQLGSLQALLLRSMSVQQDELGRLMLQYGDMFQGLTLVDADGNEMARVSQSHAFSPSELTSRAGDAAFEAAIEGAVYVADRAYLAPDGAFPAVTVAVPMEGRDRDGVLIADVSLKGMWDAINQVDVGQTGYAYLINRSTGELIGHSDLARYLVLEGRTVDDVMLVRRVMRGAVAPQAEYVGLDGERVVGAAANLPDTDWALVVELPASEALSGVRRMLYLLGVLTVVGAVAAGGLGLIVPRRVVRPILALQDGAQEIGAGNLEHVIDVRTGDELEDLAGGFNRMAANLRRSHQELARWGQELEVRVDERTTELAQMSRRMQRRADQLQISAEVSHAIASVRDLDDLLPQVTRLISERFGWYHVGIFLLDKAPEYSAGGSGSRYAVLRAANSAGGQRMLARGHRLKVGETGIVGTVTATGEPRIALDVGEDAVYFDNPDLRETRSEMALPLMVGDEIIGALDVQSTEPAAYDDEDVALLSTLSDQVAVAIENALLFERSQQALREVQELHRRYVRQEWARVVDSAGEPGSGRRQDKLVYEYRRDPTFGRTPDGGHAGAGDGAGEPDGWPAELRRAVAEGTVVAEDARPLSWSQGAGQALTAEAAGREGAPRAALAAPIKFRDQVIGALDLEDVGTPRRWTTDEVALVQAIADQVGLALENARLFADTQRRAEQLAMLHQVGLDITSALDLDGVLQALYEQIRRMVDTGSFYVALYDETTDIVEFPFVTGIDGRIEVAPMSLRREAQAGARDGRSLTAQVIESGEVLHVPDLLQLPEGSRHHPVAVSARTTRAYLGIPLVFRERVFGLMSVQSYEAGAYSQEEIDLLNTIAIQASIAIQNARAYERLVETAEQLREVDRLKTQFLANMSHELRTPLNSIIGFSRVMLKGIDGPLTDLQEADLTSIYNSGQHLLGLINSILDMSKIEAGKMDLSFDEVRLDDIFQAVLSTTRALIKDEPIELIADVPADLPAVWVDAQRVRQILINLFSNAAKFTEEGSITLSAGVTGEFVTITVADTGIGIDPDVHSRLFIPFQQVDASTTRRAGGTGLGLAISRSFVEMHGGKIWVESEPGQGAAFSFTLPLVKVEAEAKVEVEAAAEPGAEVEAVEPAPRPDIKVQSGMLGDDNARLQQDPAKIVLAIDDDQGVITLLKRYLENDGYEVVGVRESDEALSVARRLAAQGTVPVAGSGRPEEHRAGGDGLSEDGEQRSCRLAAITLDIVMPRPGNGDPAHPAGGHRAEEGGWEILRALKHDAVTKEIPVIVCSILEGLEKGLAMGAAACLRKPLTRSDLLATLRKVEVVGPAARSPVER